MAQTRPKYDRSILLRNSGALPALGNSLEVQIPRRAMRLGRIDVVFTVTLTAAGTVASDLNYSLFDIFERIQLQVSDTGGDSRTVVDADGASLIQWHRNMGYQLDRWQAEALYPVFVDSQSVTTFTVRVPIHFLDQRLGDAARYVTCLPMSASEGMKADPILKVKLDSKLRTHDNVTLAISGAHVGCEYLPMPADHPYVPTSLLLDKISNAQSAAAKWTYEFKQGNMLSAAQVITFEDPGWTTLGAVLADGGVFRLEYGSQDLGHFTQEDAIAFSDWHRGAVSAQWTFPRTAVLNALPNANNCFMLDFLQPHAQENGISAQSIIDLRSANSGDLLKLHMENADQTVSAKVLSHKFFIAPEQLPLLSTV